MLISGKALSALLEAVEETAVKYSECKKVQVGAVVFATVCGTPHPLAYGCNHTHPVSCKEYGCKRVNVYGEDSDKHRLPSDCRAIHAEIEAIASAARKGVKIDGCSILISRYPCESCAKAIVTSGIEHVFYAGEQLISEETKAIFDSARVDVIHIERGKDETERK